MNQLFNRVLEHVLKWEGGYVNDPNDPGGETNYGISARAYPNLDIRSLTKDQAADIYFRDYWLKVGADKLPTAIAICAFDCAVNQGVGRALMWLADIEAQGFKNNAFVFMSRRVKHYVGLKGLWLHYGRGWMNRHQDTLELVGELAGELDNA